jgi:hypothetical protein
MDKDAEPVFMYLLAICTSLLEKWLVFLLFMDYLLTGLFGFVEFSFLSYLYILLIPWNEFLAKIFSGSVDFTLLIYFAVKLFNWIQ